MKMHDDQFLKSLKNRPGLKPRVEFKKELGDKLQAMQSKKRDYSFFKVPFVLGVVCLLVFLIMSDNMVKLFSGDLGNQGTHTELINNGEFIGEEEALFQAKKRVSESNMKWELEFMQHPKEIEEHIFKAKPVWKVVGTYPLGNQDVFYLDAKTGDLLFMKALESDGSEKGTNEGRLEYGFDIVEINDRLDIENQVYKGTISLYIGEREKKRWKKGYNLGVRLFGNHTSLGSMPLFLDHPEGLVTVPFEFDLESEERPHPYKLTGNIRVTVEVNLPSGVTLYEQEVKKIVLE